MLGTRAILFVVFLVCTTLHLDAQNIVQAEPLSGMSVTKFFLQQHLKYPHELIKQQKSGSVTVGLSVDKDGIGHDYHIIKSFDERASAEAIRLVKKIIWKASTVHGIPTESDTEIQVKFSVRHYKKQQQNKAYIDTTFANIPISKAERIYTYAALKHTPKPNIPNGKNIYQHINEQLIYPEQAFARSIEGDVEVEFVVEENGLPSNFIIKKTVGGGCDNEAIRILQSIEWFPAVYNDSIVRCHTSMKISFRLGDKKQQAIPNRQGSSF